MFCIKGKTAIITGGNKSLGLGITQAMVDAGVKVCIMASSASVHDVAKDFSNKGHEVYGVQVDLNDKAKIEASFKEALALLGGKIDILVNNAGIQRRNKCEDFLQSDWDDVINVNLNAIFTLCQLAGREMLKQESGRIINMASMLSFFGGQTVPAYAASKGGVMQLTKALSNEWASKGITVNSIAPGYMDTEMNTALVNDEARNAQITARIPLGRWGNPKDIGGVAVFLATEEARYITGATIPVDGGYLAK